MLMMALDQMVCKNIRKFEDLFIKKDSFLILAWFDPNEVWEIKGKN